MQDIMISMMAEQWFADKNTNENVYAFNNSTCFSIAASDKDTCSFGLIEIDGCHDDNCKDNTCNADNEISTMEPKPSVGVCA
jgi:hypothetical protein